MLRQHTTAPAALGGGTIAAAVPSLGSLPPETAPAALGWGAADGLRSQAAAARREDSAQFILFYPLGPESAHTLLLFAVGNVRPEVVLEVVQREKRPVSKSGPYPSFSCVFFFFAFFFCPKKNCCGDQRCSAAALLLVLLLLLRRPKYFL